MVFDWLRTSRPAASVHVETKDAGYGFVALHMQGEAGWTRTDYAGLAREGFGRNPVVFRSLKLVAEGAASMPWLLYQGSRELSQHPALELLNKPNGQQTGAALLETVFGHLMIGGDAYVEMVSGGAARELHVLRPDKVTVVADRSGWPVALDYAAGAGKRRIVLGDEADALHIKLFHPLDDHQGLAPLQAAAMAVDMHNAAGRWNKALLDNSARPSGALVYAPKEGGNLTEEQYDKIKSELEQKRTGAAGAGRPLILEGGLDWKSMGLTPKDMDFIEAKNSAARDIALAFGVPPMLLGIPGDNTYSNYREANRALWTQTVLPLAGRVADEMSAWLSQMFGEELRFVPDADQVEALSADREALWRRIGEASFLTDDEKREAVGYGARG